MQTIFTKEAADTIVSYPLIIQPNEAQGMWIQFHYTQSCHFFHIDDLQEQDFQIRNHLINAGYKKLKIGNKTFAYMIYSQLSNLEQATVMPYESTLDILLKNERTLMNMVPYQGLESYFFQDSPVKNECWKMLRPHEEIGGSNFLIKDIQEDQIESIQCMLNSLKPV